MQCSESLVSYLQLCYSPALTPADDAVKPVLKLTFKVARLIKSWQIIAFGVAGKPIWRVLATEAHLVTERGVFQTSLPVQGKDTGGRREMPPHQPPVCSVCSSPGMDSGPDSDQCSEGPHSRMDQSPGASAGSSCSSEMWALLFLPMFKGQRFLFEEFIPQNH